MAAIGFCEENVVVDEKERKIELSKIFYYFASDFGNNQEELLQSNDFLYFLFFLFLFLTSLSSGISTWLSEEKKKTFHKLVSSGHFTITYADYDWGLNGS